MYAEAAACPLGGLGRNFTLALTGTIAELTHLPGRSHGCNRDRLSVTVSEGFWQSRTWVIPVRRKSARMAEGKRDEARESGTRGKAGRRGKAGKRDGYDIDKMGSFGLWFGDATNSAGRSLWNGFSRLESRRGANAVVRESGRLPSIRAGF